MVNDDTTAMLVEVAPIRGRWYVRMHYEASVNEFDISQGECTIVTPVDGGGCDIHVSTLLQSLLPGTILAITLDRMRVLNIGELPDDLDSST